MELTSFIVHRLILFVSVFLVYSIRMVGFTNESSHALEISQIVSLGMPCMVGLFQDAARFCVIWFWSLFWGFYHTWRSKWSAFGLRLMRHAQWVVYACGSSYLRHVVVKSCRLAGNDTYDISFCMFNCWSLVLCTVNLIAVGSIQLKRSTFCDLAGDMVSAMSSTGLRWNAVRVLLLRLCRMLCCTVTAWWTLYDTMA
jgi:hypothetical protein